MFESYINPQTSGLKMDVALRNMPAEAESKRQIFPPVTGRFSWHKRMSG